MRIARFAAGTTFFGSVAGVVLAFGFFVRPAGATTVTGKVKDSVSGALLSGVKVEVVQQSGKSATTNSSGVYSILYVSAGSVTLRASKTAYVTQTTGGLSVPSSGTKTAPDILLVKMGTITGKVVNASGGAAISGATVTVTGTGNSATTDSSGSFTLYQATGTYTLTVSKTGWMTATTGNISVTNNKTTTVPNILLTQTATVKGTVKESGSGTLLSGVIVKLHSNPSISTSTDSSGSFTLNNVPVGSQSLDLSRSGYASQTTSSFNVVAGTNTVGPFSMVKSTGNITGVIGDAQNSNAGLGGATVKVNGITPVISTTTAANGSYTLTGVPTGARTVNASLAGYVAASSGNINVTQGQTVNAGTLALNRTTVTVTGTVKDNATHAALEGARVTVQEQSDRTEWTDGAGAYALAGVYWGDVHLEISKDDYSTKTAAVTLTAAGPNAYDILLDSAFGTMTGTVVDTATGFGLIGARVNLNGDDSIATDTDWEGHYTLTRVPSGSQSIRAVRDGYGEGPSGDVEIQPGQQANVAAIRLTPEYSHLTGVVRDGNTGEPVADVVLISARTGALLVTDQSGTFSFDWLEPGYDVVAFQKDGTSPMVSDPVAIPPGSTTSIELWTRPPGGGPNGTVHGVVRDTAGAPIGSANVTVPGFPSVQTATDGTYSMAVPPGRYVVKAEKSGYRTILSEHHGDNALFVSTHWQMVQDFALPTAEETAAVIISTTDPIQRTPREGRIWLESLFGFYEVATGPAGENHTITGVPAGPVVGWLLPRVLQPASTTALDFWVWPEAPTTAPRWAAGGLVYRAVSGEPVSGAVATLSNSSRDYQTTTTTDGNGRWSFSSGPEGEYSVTIVGEGGLTSPEPWTFTAADDGSLFINDVGLVAPGDDGSLTIDEPTAGTIVKHSPLVVRCSVTLPKPGDYVLAVEVSLSNTDIKTAPVVYEPDGKHFRVDLSEISGEGDQVLTVTAITRTGSFTHGNWPTASIPLSLHLGPSLASLTLNPGELPGGATSLATIALDRPAAAGGMEVNLTSANPAVANVPASVVVAEGSSNAEFTVTTLSVAVQTAVGISATAGGDTKTVTLVVDPASVASVDLSPSAVAGGLTSTGTVTLDGPAPAGGLTVYLTSADPAVATVPPTVTVPAEATSAEFAIATSPVSLENVILISATANGATKTAQLTVGPIGVASLALSPANLVGGQTSTGTVTLNAPATAEGFVVSLSSSDPTIASVPTTVTITAGVTSAQFTVTTDAVASTASITISATSGAATRLAALTVNPLLLQSLTLSPATVVGGQSSTGTVAVNGPAPTGGFTVSLTSEDPAVAVVPPSVTLAQGATSTSFTIGTSNPSTIRSVAISAVANGNTRTATLTIKPIGVSQFSLAYPKAGGGATVSGTLYLTSSAPAGGTVVSLASDNPAAASVPASVTVPGGQSSAKIAVTTYAIASPTLVTITASAGGATRTATLTVGPAQLSELELNPTSLAAGLESYHNSVRLDSPAGTGGVTVSLTSSYGYVHVPATVTVPLGSVTADFTLSAWEARCTPVPVVISAVSGSVTKTADFTLQATTLKEVSLYRPTVVAGGSTTLRVDLRGWENREGCPVVLSSSDNSVASVWGGLEGCQPSGSGFMGDAWFRCPVDVTTSAAAPPGATVTLSATLQGHTDSVTLTITAPDISGVAPGLALPGDTVVVYGPAFAQNSTVMVQGPYETTPDPFGFPPSCKTSGGVCPTTDLPATVNTDGTALSFAVPAGLQDGAYHLWTKNASGALSNVNRWFIVDTAAKTIAVVPPDQHNLASRIYPGQTITGTLTGDNAAGGVADFNFFYFVGTAGSRINVSMERVDGSKSWEHPDSLDPQIEIFAPDGFLPQNLVAWDNQPGVDLNSSLRDAVLPLTGLYVIAAETTRGHGGYRLSFSFSSLAPPRDGERIFELAGADRTVPVGSSFETVALTLDPRGYPISGASVAYAAHSAPDNQGTVGFVGGAHALTNPDGSSFKDVVFSSAGKAEFGPSFIGTFTGSPLAAPEAGPRAVRVRGPIPRYQPVAHLAASVGSLRPDGTLTLHIGSFQRLPIERRHARTEARESGVKPDAGSGGGSLSLGERAGVRGSGWERLPGATAPSRQDVAPTGGTDFEPIDASTAVPLPEPKREMIARAQAITSCTAAPFRAAGTTAAQVNPPYTVTLTDLTPSTGQTQPNGEVGVEGIHGHRVEKVVRLRIQIKDKYDVEPTYPVLVHLATGGPQHGTLILDPDGTRKECNQASFLWHERDTQGNLVALNEEFEYRMGTWSRYVGVEPDGESPGGVKPVWGVAEDLGIRLETPDGAPLSYTVHPEPGKPDHFACWERPNLPCGDAFAYWTGIFSGSTLSDAYHLEDDLGNATYGYTNTAASQPGGGVSVEFTDQTSGSGGDFAGYTLTTKWPTSPAFSGHMASTLSVAYPDDPDWSGGTVTKQITFDLSGGSSHLLVQKQNYDARFGADDSAWPMTVSPGAGEGTMPKTASGDTPRLVLLALSGSSIPSRIPAGPYYGIAGQDEPSLDPTHVYRNTGGGWSWVEATDQDAVLEVGGGGEFRLSLVDSSGTAVPGTAFRVYRCPRSEHLTAEQPPGDCTLGPVDSEALTGTLSSITLNEAGSARGYLGIELTKAPVNPGQYFILVESIGSTPYRIRWESQLIGRASPEEDLWGGFVICNVLGGEILDENFKRIQNLILDHARIVYVRLTEPAEPASGLEINFSTENDDGTQAGFVSGVHATRLGLSPIFLSEPITVIPAEGLVPASTGPMVVRALEMGKTVPGPQTQGEGMAWRGSVLEAKATISPGVQFKFFVDTTVNGQSYRSDGSARNPTGGQQPNLLYADGASTTTISAWAYNVATLAGIAGYPLTATLPSLANGALLSGGAPVTSASAVTDANGWAQFTFQAAPLSSVPEGTFVRGSLVLTRGEDPGHRPLASTQIFSYGMYDFRALPLDKAADLDLPGPGASAIQYLFLNYIPGQESFLARLFFKGETAFYDRNQRCTFESADCTAVQGDPAYDPYGSHDYEKPSVESISAARKFAMVAESTGISATLVLAKAQSEQGLLAAPGPTLPSSGALNWALGCGYPSDLSGQIQCAATTIFGLRDAQTDRNSGLPVPTDGPFFLSPAYFPIEVPKNFNHSVMIRDNDYCGDKSIQGAENVAFEAPNRGNYVLWVYTPWVQTCNVGQGGGNRELSSIIRKVRRILNEAP